MMMEPSIQAPAAGRHRRSTELADALTKRIRDRVLRPGDKLPTEAEIGLEYGVSRTVVREAMSQLQAGGLVETRHGVGTFVVDSSRSFVFRVAAGSIPTVQAILAMLELRISLESEAAALAAMRRTDLQLEEIRRALDDFKAELQSGSNAGETDFLFHLRIAETTGNRYFAEVMSNYGTATIPRTRLTVFQSPEARSNFLSMLSREHEQIFNAIARGDANAAAKFMRIHLSNSRDRFGKAQLAASYGD